MKEMIHDTLKVKNMKIKCRVIMPPLATSKANLDGSVTDDLVHYYDEKSQGGYLGFIITEHMYISPEGKASLNQVSISKDEDIVGLKRIVDVIHKNGTKAICQISHAGAASGISVTGFDSVSSSPTDFYLERSKQRSRELTVAEIHSLTHKFVDAAIRAKKAGYDGVEIHCAHAYLLNQFYSPIINKRTDEYGCQSMENRLRFLVEVIRAVRSEVGVDYPILVRLGGCDYMPGGNTINDAVQAAIVLEKENIDILDISGGMNRYTIANRNYPGYFKDMTIAIKKAVSIPVILTGGVTSAAEAEELLHENAADLIGVGRSIYKDSNWARENLGK